MERPLVAGLTEWKARKCECLPAGDGLAMYLEPPTEDATTSERTVPVGCKMGARGEEGGEKQ